MSVPAYVVIPLVAAFALSLLSFIVIRGIRSYLMYRGQRLITRPENHRPAAVAVNELRAGRGRRNRKEQGRVISLQTESLRIRAVSDARREES